MHHYVSLILASTPRSAESVTIVINVYEKQGQLRSETKNVPRNSTVATNILPREY